MTLIFFFLGFFASRLLLCWPLAMSISSFGLRMTQGGGVFFVLVTHQFNNNDLDGLTDSKRLARNSAAPGRQTTHGIVFD
jgi:hypothetical protein